jgi:hypothetical protein
MIKTVSIELPIYDMEEFDTYIDKQIKDYRDYLVAQLDDDSGYYDDRDITHTKMLIDHYDDILTGLRSTYTTKNGSIRDEYLDYI